MTGYQGMRWFRCDLQVQTPEDGRHWDPDDLLRLGSPRTEVELQDMARQYLRRCHEVDLDVIAVTDHNFCAHRKPRERFLAHLIEQNKTVAREAGRDPLWIFPGFEIDIGYHLLCLFPPVGKAKDLGSVCDILTELGLGPKSRFDDGVLAPLRRVDGYVRLSEILMKVQDQHGGLVIAAHAFERNGIAKEAKWAGDYRNEELLAVEISKFPLGERERAVLEAQEGDWKRRPPAYIQSSDAKSTLTEEEGKPRPNSLGYRWTWIKMSKPSIEALRQAFLDPSSRIRQREQEDPRRVRHTRIVSLQVAGSAFLEDQEISFAPGLTCIIGGRGSGKSSLLEYVRWAVRREDDVQAEDKISYVGGTLGAGTSIVLNWREGDRETPDSGLVDEFFYVHGAGRAGVFSREVTEPATVFRNLDLQILSQGQISSISKEPSFLLALIDGLVGQRLRVLQEEEAELRDRLRHLFQQRRLQERLEGEIANLTQEVAELERRWQARAAVQKEQKRHRAARQAEDYLTKLDQQTEALVAEFSERVEELVEGHSPLGSLVEGWPQSAYFQDLDREVDAAKVTFGDELRRAVSRYQARLQQLTTGSQEWNKVAAAIRRAEKDFRAACAREGLQPEELEQLLAIDRERKAKAQELERKKAQQRQLRKELSQRRTTLDKLHAIWRQQTEARQAELGTILSKANQQDRTAMKVTIDYLGDRSDFLKAWDELVPKRTTRLGMQWQRIGHAAVDEFLTAQAENAPPGAVQSPWQVIRTWLQGKREMLPEHSEFLPLLQDHLASRREEWDHKTLQRVQDRVDLLLYHSNGSLVGSLVGNQLSEGQKNTALLILLLSRGQGPILIDQPEDEIDSSFLFQHLVPLLRRIKHERQVILVTHNANLAVNGDAELIYALAASSEGRERSRGKVSAQGGLDREEVKEAVLEIMEGSEEAFRRRREKYHF